MTFKLYFTYLLNIALTSALLWHFSNIWRFEWVLIGEPNLWIRTGETLLLAAILIYNLTQILRRTK